MLRLNLIYESVTSRGPATAPLTCLRSLDLKPRNHRRRQQRPQIINKEEDVIMTKHSLDNIDKLANKDAANQLKADLNIEDDSKRTMKEIDTTTASQLFGIFNLKDPGCDKNKDNVIKGDELTCLNKIWKYYVPPN